MLGFSHSLKPPTWLLLNPSPWGPRTGSLRQPLQVDSKLEGRFTWQPSRSLAVRRALSPWCTFVRKGKRSRPSSLDEKLGSWGWIQVGLKEIHTFARTARSLHIPIWDPMSPFMAACQNRQSSPGFHHLIKGYTTGPVMFSEAAEAGLLWVPLISPFSTSRDFKLYIYFLWDKKKSIASLACSWKRSTPK